MKLQFCFVAVCKSGQPVGLHAHRALELVYYTDGRGSGHIGSTRHALHRNVFTITPAAMAHDQHNDTTLTSLCIGILDSGLERLVGAWRDTDGNLRRACERLIFEMESKPPVFRLVADGLLLEIVGLAERCASQPVRAETQSALVSQAIGIIRGQNGMLSVRELAGRLYLSKDYLRHLFQEHAGQSPMRHIIQARIEKAKDLLTDPLLSIGEIAQCSGFENVYYFSRLFKKETGRTPSSYRTWLRRGG